MSAAPFATPAPAYGIARLVAIVFLPFATGYFMSYVFRSINAVIAPQLSAEVGLTAGDLGFLTSTYFLTFAAFQFPLGILLDRYGPRRVQTVLLLVAASGAVVFGFAHDITMMSIGRAMIGMGVAGSLMSSFKAFTIWFPVRLWPILNGFMLGVGGLGAMSVTTPLEVSLHYMDWREIFFVLSAVTAVASILIFIAVPEMARDVQTTSLGIQLKELGQIYSDPLLWRILPLLITTFAANLSIQGLWAGPWLSDVAGFGRDGVAFYLMVLAGALAGGSVLIGMLASGLARIGVPLLVTLAFGALLFAGFQAVIVLELAPQALWPWIGFGLLANIVMLAYPVMSSHFPPHQTGRVATGMNLFLFGGVFLTQFLMGKIIDLWPPIASGGYDPAAYFAAFGLILGLQLVAFIWFLVPSGGPRG